VTAALAAAFWRAARRRQVASFVAICFSVPVLAGYTYLILRGYRLDNNSSYNAYKLLSVFYPGVLAVACYWVTLGRQDGPALVILRAAMIVVVSAFTLNSAHTFSVRLRNPPLMVTPDLVQLSEVEAMPAVTSINVRFPDVWSRLWANAFLLRKAQYFQWDTYEGRRQTPLRGEWDLNGGTIQVRLPGGKAATSPNFSLISNRDPYFLRATERDGWYDPEENVRTGRRWRWTQGATTIVVENPQHYPLLTSWYFHEVRSLKVRDFQMSVAGKAVGQMVVGIRPREIVISNVLIPPGETSVQFSSPSPLTLAGNGDTRQLGFRIHGIQIEVHENPVGATASDR